VQLLPAEIRYRRNIMSDEYKPIKVPTFLTGVLSRVEGVSYCMDGADYSLQTMAGAVRVKAGNAGTGERLGQDAGRRRRVTVGGYPIVGPEPGCNCLTAYYAAPAIELHQAIKGEGAALRGGSSESW
jgi:hypothetical protein